MRPLSIIQVLVGGALVFTATLSMHWHHRATIDLRETNSRHDLEFKKASSQAAEARREMDRANDEIVQLRRVLEELKRARLTPLAAQAQSASSSVNASPGQIGTGRPTADPELNPVRKARWHKRYDAFFTERQLTPDQIARIMDLWVVQADAREDVQASLREANLRGDAKGVDDLYMKLTAETYREFRTILGEEGYAAYNRYEKTSFFRMAFVDRMQPAFTAAGAPLSAQQSEKMVGLVAENARAARKNAWDFGSSAQIDWDAVANKASRFLSPSQQTALLAHIAQENIGRP